MGRRSFIFSAPGVLGSVNKRLRPGDRGEHQDTMGWGYVVVVVETSGVLAERKSEMAFIPIQIHIPAHAYKDSGRHPHPTASDSFPFLSNSVV